MRNTTPGIVFRLSEMFTNFIDYTINLNEQRYNTNNSTIITLIAIICLLELNWKCTENDGVITIDRLICKLLYSRLLFKFQLATHYESISIYL